MAMLGQRAGFKPIEPVNDEMMGMRNLQATSGGAINAPDQYYATQAGISGLGDAYSDRAASFARNVAADAHSGMGNTDEQQNQRIQELYKRRDELEEEIRNLEAEIAWQEKLRDNEMSGDPMWEVAKQQYIQKGDSSALESIMNRRTTVAENEKSRKSQEEIAKLNAKKESADKQEANERSARFARNNLNDALIYYETVKGDSEKRILAANDLLARKNQFMEAAEISGKKASEYIKDDPEFLERVDAAINEGRSTQTAKIDTKNANYTKNKKAWDANAKKALDRYNKFREKGWSYARIEDNMKEALKYLNVDANGNATVKSYSGG